MVEFYVSKDNKPETRMLYRKTPDGTITKQNPSQYLYDYLLSQGMVMQENIITPTDNKVEEVNPTVVSSPNTLPVEKIVPVVNNASFIMPQVIDFGSKTNVSTNIG